MNIYFTNKQSDSKTLITSENADILLRDGLKIAIFKTRDQVEALVFNARDYYGDIIARETKGSKYLRNMGLKSTRSRSEDEKVFISSGVISFNPDAKALITDNKVTRIADKRFGNKLSTEGLGIEEIKEEVMLGLKEILGMK